jgi:phosphatidylglycerol lysyltransferase
MNVRQFVKQQTRINRQFAVQFLSILVGAHGVYILAETLLAQISVHRASHLTDLLVDLPLLIGLSVIYLSTLLKRRKRTAWLVTITAYAFYLGSGTTQLLLHIPLMRLSLLEVIRVILLPLVILGLLLIFHNEFVVRSDIQGFRSAIRFIVIILVIALFYGVVGFQLLDDSDFHQEIGVTSSIHYTIDQFNLTTNKPVHPYTKRAHLFLDSLSFVSLFAVLYGAFSLFQPLRAKFADQSDAREKILKLLEQYETNCEEFFKLWPHDKQYYFDDSGQSAIAFHVFAGVALCLSDPIGNPERFVALMAGFQNQCFNNDWLPSMVHVSEQYIQLYERSGFSLQKLGQEAIVNIEHFENKLSNSKYFRQIRNRFDKNGYSFELLSPPHHDAVLSRLKAISDEWLSKGGRAERGFVMGYYTEEYMQNCQLMVARDAAGTIQAFLNKVPAIFDKKEATYDLLRQSDAALSNVNDYLLMNMIKTMHTKGYKRINMGLSPLAGLNDEDQTNNGLLDNVLKFAYANGDRFYSFSGLYKFKSKYEPDWHDKYIGYHDFAYALHEQSSKALKY